MDLLFFEALSTLRSAGTAPLFPLPAVYEILIKINGEECQRLSQACAIYVHLTVHILHEFCFNAVVCDEFMIHGRRTCSSTLRVPGTMYTADSHAMGAEIEHLIK